MAKQVHVVLGVAGSIAAYKAAELVRLMKKRAWLVSVIMTRAAKRFVGELTFQTLSQNPVLVDEFEQSQSWNPSHVSLADWADLLVIAPCTANVIAKIAHGLADDALSSTALACKAPLIIAPAMNENMWLNPATQDNLRIIKSRGAKIVNPQRGSLACGWAGEGRLAALEEIMKAVEKVARSRQIRSTPARADCTGRSGKSETPRSGGASSKFIPQGGTISHATGRSACGGK